MVADAELVGSGRRDGGGNRGETIPTTARLMEFLAGQLAEWTLGGGCRRRCRRLV